MTVGELISLLPVDSPIQINIITEPGCLVFIPDPAFYRENPKIVASVDQLPVTSINVEVEEVDGKQIILLMLNENVNANESALAVD